MIPTAYSCVLLSLVASIQGVPALASLTAAVTAPKVTVSAFDEARPMLYASDLIYTVASVLDKARDVKIDLKAPDKFPIKDLNQFHDESLDLREYNNGNGLSFGEVMKFLEYNTEELSKAKNHDFAKEVQSLLKDIDDGIGSYKDDVFLSTLRSIEGDIACVYSVVKDTKNKRIIVTFRGSQAPFTNRDWKTNFNARMISLRTPKRIANKMKGVVKNRVLVHRGFYEYLFNNKLIDGQQRYDQICGDVKSLMEKGYSLYVTGHSLGAALATLFSFKLAGAGPSKDWVPRPITAITYAAPYSGSRSYRAAFEQEEIDGLIRSLRINNGEDIIPTIPPISLGARKRLMKQTGINCRLHSGGVKLVHSSKNGFFDKIVGAMRNSFLKPIWNAGKWHDIPLHKSRMIASRDILSAKTLDELYKDPAVVGKDFLAGKTGFYDAKEKGDRED